MARESLARRVGRAACPSSRHGRCSSPANRSKASGPRTSPTMMRFRPHAQAVSSPDLAHGDLAFRLRDWAGRVSRRTVCGCCSCNSAGILAGDDALVVFDELGQTVEQRSLAGAGTRRRTMVLIRQRPITRRSSAPSSVMVPNLTSWSSVSLSFLNLRMVSAGAVDRERRHDDVDGANRRAGGRRKWARIRRRGGRSG